jgi:hypothetical protein
MFLGTSYRVMHQAQQCAEPWDRWTDRVFAVLLLQSSFLFLFVNTTICCCQSHWNKRLCKLPPIAHPLQCTASLGLACMVLGVQIWPSQISPNNQPGHRSSFTRQDGARDGRRERAILFFPRDCGEFDEM